MADLDLSSEPLGLKISLTRGEDFVRVIEPLNANGTDGAFAGGTELTLDFGDAGQWAATVTSSAATWSIDKVDSDAMMDALPSLATCTLRYRSGEVDRIWAIGRVTLNG